MRPEFQVKHPLPRRRAHQALRDQLIEYLLRERPAVGERFLSDHQLVLASGLSRPTVRRALDDLTREGWIERRHGLGTYIGPRLALEVRQRAPLPTERQAGRLALLIRRGDAGPFDWQSKPILEAIEHASSDARLTIELLGLRDANEPALIKQLSEPRPDVLAAISPGPEQSFVLAEARRQGIPLLVTGSRMNGMGLPTVREDGIQGARIAVEHLLSHGHRRIGFVQEAQPAPWVFERREGYLAAMRDAGIDTDEGMVCWTVPGHSPQQTHQVLGFLRHRRPTAVLFGAARIYASLLPVLRSSELHIPGDLSVVCFDQIWAPEAWLDVGRPTLVELPLAELGLHLVRLARQSIDGLALTPPSPLPCTLREGATVARV